MMSTSSLLVEGEDSELKILPGWDPQMLLFFIEKTRHG